MKRYILQFDFDPVPAAGLQENEYPLYAKSWDYTKQDYADGHAIYGSGNSLKTMKGYISKIKREHPSQHPHNFRVFDFYADEVEPFGEKAQVYFQAE